MDLALMHDDKVYNTNHLEPNHLGPNHLEPIRTKVVPTLNTASQIIGDNRNPVGDPYRLRYTYRFLYGYLGLGAFACLLQW